MEFCENKADCVWNFVYLHIYVGVKEWNCLRELFVL